MIDKNIPPEHKQALYHTYCGIIDITYPGMAGSQHSVLFVHTNEGDYVVKFGNRDVVEKNAHIARFLRYNNILVPDIHVVNYRNTWMETYKQIPGRTLFEHIGDNMDESCVRRAYCGMLSTFAKMDKIVLEKIPRNLKCCNIHDVSYDYNLRVNNPMVAAIFYPIIYAMNCGAKRDKGLYQCDMTPKNVIVDSNGNLTSLLDVDSIAICNRDFALGIMAEKWVRLGFDRREFYDMCEEITGRKTNRARVDMMLKLASLGKSIMWRTNKHNKQK